MVFGSERGKKTPRSLMNRGIPVNFKTNNFFRLGHRIPAPASLFDYEQKFTYMITTITIF